jgi:HD-like signal output (HDOD) protein
MCAAAIQKLTLEQVTLQMEALPSVPDVVLKLSQLLEDPNITAEELGKVIQCDPQLTAQMLRTSNSAFYGITREITSIKDAVTILGQKVLKSQVYAILSHKMLNRKVSGYGLEKGELWQAALAGAVYAKRLALRFKFAEPDTAFTIAVLRDIGKLVIHEQVGNIFKDLEREAQKNKQGFQQAEKQLLGFSHTELGELIGSQWNFPKRIKTVVRYHHDPSQAPKTILKDDAQLLCIVHLADALCMMLGQGAGNDALLYSIDLDYLNRHGFTMSNETIQALMMEMLSCQSELKQLQESIQAE